MDPLLDFPFLIHFPASIEEGEEGALVKLYQRAAWKSEQEARGGREGPKPGEAGG